MEGLCQKERSRELGGVKPPTLDVGLVYRLVHRVWVDDWVQRGTGLQVVDHFF